MHYNHCKVRKKQRENNIISSIDAYMKQHSLLLLAEETSSIMELDPVQIALNIPPSMKIDFANKDIRSFWGLGDINYLFYNYFSHLIAM